MGLAIIAGLVYLFLYLKGKSTRIATGIKASSKNDKTRQEQERGAKGVAPLGAHSGTGRVELEDFDGKGEVLGAN